MKALQCSDGLFTFHRIRYKDGSEGILRIPAEASSATSYLTNKGYIQYFDGLICEASADEIVQWFSEQEGVLLEGTVEI